jgi:DNA-directed RNA polymerase subunit L
MNAKLTLTIDKNVIEKAKIYAKNENRSLSNLIESFLRQVSNDEKIEDEYEIHPDIAAMRGSIKMPENLSLDYKKEIEEARMDRYLKKING